ncbi:MAG TPA: AEC family transporter [Segeticoccus sp.]|uniref:AEC family transporter n=1 Tax=Segeticoccus sp. TaxID=2706531 RepID=UPI002D80219A|nr:AEC family transporter [Segeticoccus sp.]HET8601209.1 AEC family transporter [Segeticoccus sp.]
MQGVLTGFWVIIAVIALGFGLAHFGVLREEAQRMLTRLTFFVATPALLFRLLARSDVHEVLSAPLAVAALSIAVSAGLQVLLSRRVWRLGTDDTVISTLASCYVNAGNLGLPIAIYALGNGAAVVPVMLLQLVVLAPTAFAVLDSVTSGRRVSLGMILTMPVRNPITVGTLLGLLWSISGWTLPKLIGDPVTLVGDMAVPAALLAYGISLRLGPRPLGGVNRGQVTGVALLKLVVQPVAAYAAGRWLFGLSPHELLTVTVMAALPTAQNIFIYASRYQRSIVLARDAIFVTTVLSVPTILVLTALLA